MLEVEDFKNSFCYYNFNIMDHCFTARLAFSFIYCIKWAKNSTAGMVLVRVFGVYVLGYNESPLRLHFASPLLSPASPCHSPLSSHISYSMKQISHGARRTEKLCGGSSYSGQKAGNSNTFRCLHFSKG